MVKYSKALFLIILLASSLVGVQLVFDPLNIQEEEFVPQTIFEGTIDLKLETIFERGTLSYPTGIYFHDYLNESMAITTELKGRILLVNISNPDQNLTLLNLQSEIGRITDEEGLVGFTFDPEFTINQYVYLHYTQANPLLTKIMRYTFNGTSLINEFQLLKIEQPFANHNGGGLVFGNDNLLYIGMGDGGNSFDPLGNGQNRSNLLSTILRIDPHQTSGSLNYSIPADNPYVSNPNGYREEIFAYGIRNPYKMSIDKQTGNLWVGDVGQNEREEVNLIEKGKNYGWNYLEGTYCHYPDYCDTIDHERPEFEYTHERGNAIIGGLVYHGDDIPDLKNKYLFADWINGELFSMDLTNQSYRVETILDLPFLTSSITVDNTQEVYFCGFDGTVFKLVQG